jgi:signal transduction histidine kinase
VALSASGLGDTRSDANAAIAHGRLLVLTDVTDWANTVRMRTDFVANASHELRTPIAAIRTAVETLATMDRAEDEATASRFLDVIARHSARLEALVIDLLDLSRVESTGARFIADDLPVPRICDELHARWREALIAKGLVWTCDGAPECHTIRANPYLLRLVLDNLVDNAIKFTDRGGVVGLIVRRSPSDIRFEVHDQGCGIAAHEQQRVFERFYQVTSARTGASREGGQARGTGLGLSIVKHAVAAMGGTVALHSEVGTGTRVMVSLPLP